MCPVQSPPLPPPPPPPHLVNSSLHYGHLLACLTFPSIGRLSGWRSSNPPPERGCSPTLQLERSSSTRQKEHTCKSAGNCTGVLCGVCAIHTVKHVEFISMTTTQSKERRKKGLTESTRVMTTPCPHIQ